MLISIDGGKTWQRAAVLKFTATDWTVPQTVLVKAAHDDTLEGERKIMVSHSLMVVSTPVLKAPRKRLTPIPTTITREPVTPRR